MGSQLRENTQIPTPETPQATRTFSITILRQKKLVVEAETQAVRAKQREQRKKNRLTGLPQMLAEAVTTDRSHV